MDFVLKKRNFLTHFILFMVTAGLWPFIYLVCYIMNYNKNKEVKSQVYQEIHEREQLKKVNDLLDIELKQQKINELKIKNAKSLLELSKSKEQK